MSNHQTTPEQDAILTLACDTDDNIMIDAAAGTGKTTTLELTDQVLSKKPAIYLVFNKRNAEEAKLRMSSTTEVKTFNSLGHGIWQKFISKKLMLNTKKTADIFRDIVDGSPKHVRDTMWDAYWEVGDGVAKAKAHGYVPKKGGRWPNAKSLIDESDFWETLESRPDDLVCDLVDEVLNRSILQSYEAKIDFNDQIYMPACFGGTFPQFPTTLVDEYQDLNSTNLEMVRKLVGKDRRLIGVGDPCQNIYGFRGAVAGSMPAAVKAFKMREARLSVSFRCPSEIVKHVQWRVPHFRWFKEGGTVVDQINPIRFEDFPLDVTVICRNNAPLFALAMRMLAYGRSVNVAGTDIGSRLVTIMKKFGDADMRRAEVFASIEEWEAAKLAKESVTAPDMAACMRIFAQHGDSLGQAIAYAQHLFDQRGRVFFTTGHKAKGLEWENVFFLDKRLCRNNEQDDNLRYVISTRSRDKLTEITSDQVIE